MFLLCSWYTVLILWLCYVDAMLMLCLCCVDRVSAGAFNTRVNTPQQTLNKAKHTNERAPRSRAKPGSKECAMPCSICGRPGHNASSCYKQPPDAEVGLAVGLTAAGGQAVKTPLLLNCRRRRRRYSGILP